MIRELCSKHWCAVPLLFLSQALSKLPPSPLLGIDGLAALRCRYILTVTLSSLLLPVNNRVLTGWNSQGGSALHHDHSSSPVARRCPVLPVKQHPPADRCGNTQIEAKIRLSYIMIKTFTPICCNNTIIIMYGIKPIKQL